ncbi:MAG: methylated-DNA--[protein]-cysteine S-methyltransferase [Defluviitaleaceae bacterium]|nr:methylated-DNA--[protein]-cysteine S-methyltransferase [Defluviitaleaceae bacterium]
MASLCYDSPMGPILVKEEDEHITEISFLEADLRDKFRTSKVETASDAPVAKACIAQLEAYFAGHLKEFTVPIKLKGTDFRMQVWAALMTIPYGETISYKQLAERIDNPKAIRAVGGANHHNPISIIVPCHRVIGADGSLTGYGGGLSNKKFLLALEKK